MFFFAFYVVCSLSLRKPAPAVLLHLGFKHAELQVFC